MFQSFENFSDPSVSAERISRLRTKMKELEADGFLVPRADEHQGEYVAPHSERLGWLTSFSGSAGTALILADTAVIFVDGRYTLQVREQTDGEIFEYENLIETPPTKWLEANAENGFRLAVDPWLQTIREARLLKTSLEKAGGELIMLESNPIDEIWSDQPEPPLRPVELHDHRFCGKLAAEKLAELARVLGNADLSYTVLTDPSSIAWSFNIRGSDVPHTPLALSFAIIAADGEHQLFIDSRKLAIKEKAYLTQLCNLREPADLAGALATASESGGRIGLDEQLAAEKLKMIVEDAGGSVVSFADPARLPRACKNEAEIAGTRDAHRRDAVAVIEFLYWLDSQKPGSVDEIAAAKRLENCRRQTGNEHQMPLRDISFDTISGAGPNGAIIHYRVSTASNRKLEPNSLYLVDSGAQYADGTTDITRTVAIGEPDVQMRRHYTIVLKGLIAISKARFPVGTRGMDIDPLARIAHWNAGLDYAHGTGHGVGSFLSVHEGPQRIARTGTEKLLPGMILSNEPGYYREGEYGIRLENLILVEPPSPVAGGDIEMHSFETLTLAPFDRRLIDSEMLSDEERQWLNAYHRRVESEIRPVVEDEIGDWLRIACAPM